MEYTHTLFKCFVSATFILVIIHLLYMAKLGEQLQQQQQSDQRITRTQRVEQQQGQKKYNFFTGTGETKTKRIVRHKNH